MVKHTINLYLLRIFLTDFFQGCSDPVFTGYTALVFFVYSITHENGISLFPLSDYKKLQIYLTPFEICDGQRHSAKKVEDP